MESGRNSGNRILGGFTLIELMIVLVILAVILTIVAPGFSSVFVSTRLTGYANELVSSVYLARGEAIKRNRPITFCASSDGVSCSGEDNWEQGWVVIDSFIAVPADAVIKANPPAASGFSLVESSGVESMVFDGSGVVSPAVSFRICRQSPSPGPQEREVQVSAIGKTSVTTTFSGTCP